MNSNELLTQGVASKSIKISELLVGADVSPLEEFASNSMRAEQVFTNSIQTSSLDITDLSAGTLVVEDLVAGTADLNSLTVSTIFAAETVTASQVNIDTLNTTTSSVAQLFTNEISASQQITTNTYTVPHPKPGFTLTQKVLIGVAIALAVVAITAVLVGGASFFATSLLSFAAVEGVFSVSSSVLIAGLNIITAAQVVTTGAIVAGTAVASVLTYTVDSAADSTIAISTKVPEASSPDLRAVALNATFGKAFLSDMLFGTTPNTSVSSPYVEYLLLQNEVNGSYALPRIIGYNPQLGFFDDGAYYGSEKAYLSLCTPAPYNTLRFEENGNLAIYDLTTDPPTWQSSTQVSSIKYKSGVRTITGAAATLQQIDCIYYNEGDVGVKAQQLEQLFSQATFGQGRRVRLEKLVPLLIEGMKELYEFQELELNK